MAMAFTDVLREIDAQISKLQQARDLLTETKPAEKKGPGRPKKAAAPAAKKATARTMSEAGRKAIAAAQKKRWATAKKAANN